MIQIMLGMLDELNWRIAELGKEDDDLGRIGGIRLGFGLRRCRAEVQVRGDQRSTNQELVRHYFVPSLSTQVLSSLRRRGQPVLHTV